MWCLWAGACGICLGCWVSRKCSLFDDVHEVTVVERTQRKTNRASINELNLFE